MLQSSLKELQLGRVRVWVIDRTVFLEVVVEELQMFVLLKSFVDDRGIWKTTFQVTTKGSFAASDVSRNSSESSRPYT